MEYSINKLAQLAGVSVRTLHYYDEIELLSPKRVSSNRYRIYGQNEVNLLQQILFYRELGMPLEEIKLMVHSKNYDGAEALQGHLKELKKKKEQIDLLIRNVEKTIAASKGEIIMKDKEKFEGFKKDLVEQNEKKYGKEVRSKYGDKAMEESNAKLMGLTAEEYATVEALSQKINEGLIEAVKEGNPSSVLAQEVCAKHKEWLCFYWSSYSKEAHAGLAETYVADPRFAKYYDDIVPGGAQFLRDALLIFCAK